jgi:hypothetical protein
LVVAQLERWKKEELQKVTQKNIAIDKLNVEREAGAYTRPLLSST